MFKTKASLFLPLILWMAFTLRTAAQSSKAQYILDMVHNNPGEELTVSAFNNPAYLQKNGYNGQVFNDFTFAHAAITFDKLNPDIFPFGSVAREWVNNAANKVKANIQKAHKAGMKAYYFTDIIVLPKKLVELYRNDICDANGKISFKRPKTIDIHRLMLNELFDTFPDLDGLVIRTGETYLNNVPYHTGNNPITQGEASHVKLLNLLREEVCVKRHKKIFYRTWSFGGMHDDPQYYLNVVNQINTHPNLVFMVKHTKGDYHRTFDFNPTLMKGRHKQVVEVQCQREYEGKGAYPNYVMNGVISGFEEYNVNRPQKEFKSLNDIRHHPNFAGVWSWSRGGGWVGPYIANEFWCRLNAYVLSHWAGNTSQTEDQVFKQFMIENGMSQSSHSAFRQLCLLSARAVLRGHDSAMPTFNSEWVWWMRDEFLAGSAPNKDSTAFDSEGTLYKQFTQYYQKGLLKAAVEEKFEAARKWDTIARLSMKIKIRNKSDEEYIRVSSTYGRLLYNIIAEGWNIMAIGFEGDKTSTYDKAKLKAAIIKYDNLWLAYQKLKANNPTCATLYKPYAFVYKAPTYHKELGMAASVNKYRQIAFN
ncbi:hypothetical protein [uncultured Mucilaginibacter sp.]|uniref:hypothetical protein n=1 Tax=uncultured Mucilaginibacter sp. TaxID=797541 RepID=UPI0025CC3DD9|nr:hypothetical protein [uncultured Mucilaginibacter sp.]